MPKKIASTVSKYLVNIYCKYVLLKLFTMFGFF